MLSHELAHLWFGDLVTMEWWNGIWLNEAFATFMELKAIEDYRPDWEVWTGFGAARTAAFDVDSLASTRPIEYPVVTPEDAEGMFDVLTYEKGAAVVRMLEQFLGEEAFRAGVRRYLAEHLYGNTDNEDLWDALEAASGQPVRSLMHAWIFRGGHPLLEAGMGEDGSLQLTQSPFRYDGTDDGTRWSVPVRFRTVTGEHRVLLDPSQDTTVVDAVTDIADLRSLNVDASGFYRTTLPSAPGSPATERAAAASDRWALVLAGRAGHDSFLELAGSLADDVDLGVWQAIIGGLTTLDLLAPGRLAERAAAILGPTVERLGWDPIPDDDGRVRQLRGLVLTAAGTIASDADVIAGALARWDEPIDDPAVATAVVTVVAAHGDARCLRQVQNARPPGRNRPGRTAAPACPHPLPGTRRGFEPARRTPRRRDPQPGRPLSAARRPGTPATPQLRLAHGHQPLGRGDRTVPLQQHRPHARWCPIPGGLRYRSRSRILHRGAPRPTGGPSGGPAPRTATDKPTPGPAPGRELTNPSALRNQLQPERGIDARQGGDEPVCPDDGSITMHVNCWPAGPPEPVGRTSPRRHHQGRRRDAPRLDGHVDGTHERHPCGNPHLVEVIRTGHRSY